MKKKDEFEVETMRFGIVVGDYHKISVYQNVCPSARQCFVSSNKFLRRRPRRPTLLRHFFRFL